MDIVSCMSAVVRMDSMSGRKTCDCFFVPLIQKELTSDKEGVCIAGNILQAVLILYGALTVTIS